MMDEFGREVQAALMFAAFLTLFVKWRLEEKRTRRPVKIWVFDTSKQGFTSFSWHFLNVYISWLYTSTDPCLWYSLMVVLDATLGLGLCYLALKGFEKYVVDARMVGAFSPLEYMRSGKYGTPPSAYAWGMQLLLWQGIVVGVKVTMAALTYPVSDFLQSIARFVLAPVIKHPHAELIFVMLVLPLVLNVVTFWVSDNVLMAKKEESGPVTEAEMVLLNPWGGELWDDAVDDDDGGEGGDWEGDWDPWGGRGGGGGGGGDDDDDVFDMDAPLLMVGDEEGGLVGGMDGMDGMDGMSGMDQGGMDGMDQEELKRLAGKQS